MNFLNTLRKFTQVKTPRKFYLYAVIIGGISGFSALFFSWILAFFEDIILRDLAGVNLGHADGEFSFSNEKHNGSFKPFPFVLFPMIGLFISGLLVQLFDKESGGAGTDAMIHSFHENEGIVKKRTPFIKAMATIATLSGAGSAGKEGPIAQIGSAFGSLMAKFLGVGPKARRSLFIAGMAGALGAIFRAPLGAAIVSVEVLYREDFESDSLIPAIISSITGYFIFTSFRGFDTLFHIEKIGFSNWQEFGFYTILGIFCFLFGGIFVKTFYYVEKWFSRMPIPISLKSLIGGIGVALISLLAWEAVGSGFGFLQKIMRGQLLDSGSVIKTFFAGENQVWPLFLYLILIALLKILSTSFTIASGASGGVFGPSIFIGGILGAAVGLVSHHYFPESAVSLIPYIIVGMAGFFSGVANAPIGSVIMVCELTGGYQLLAPLLIVAVLSIILSSRFNIYRNQKINKFYSPAHNWDVIHEPASASRKKNNSIQ